MGAGKVAVVATWQGWCGACAGERPLVLTRSGRRTLRSWWGGLGDDHLPLTLTCRLCGVAVDVPLHEEDDVDPVEAEDDATTAPDLAAPVHAETEPALEVAAEADASVAAADGPAAEADAPDVGTTVPVHDAAAVTAAAEPDVPVAVVPVPAAPAPAPSQALATALHRLRQRAVDAMAEELQRRAAAQRDALPAEPPYPAEDVLAQVLPLAPVATRHSADVAPDDDALLEMLSQGLDVRHG